MDNIPTPPTPYLSLDIHMQIDEKHMHAIEKKNRN